MSNQAFVDEFPLVFSWSTSENRIEINPLLYLLFCSTYSTWIESNTNNENFYTAYINICRNTGLTNNFPLSSSFITISS